MNTRIKSRIFLAAILGLACFSEFARAQAWTNTNPNTTSASKVAVGVSSSGGVVNQLEINGSAVIGSGYTNSSTSGPTNGLAIQGSLGIGTTTPAASLDINGNIQLSGVDASPSAGRSIVKGGSGHLNLYSNTYYGNSYNWIEMFGNDASNLGELRLTGKKIMFMDNTDGAGAFTVGMTLSSAGNLSIGPNGFNQWGFDGAQALDVHGNVQFSGALMPNADPGTSGTILMSQGAGVAPIWTNGNSIAWLLNGNAGTTFGTNFIGTTDPTSLMFKTNNAEVASFLNGGDMRIGQQGVGTALPVTQYPPSGNGIIFSGGGSFGTFDDDNSDPLWIARNNVASDKSELRMVLGDNALTGMNAFDDDFLSIGAVDNTHGQEFVSRVRVNATGEVGVGTIPDGGAGFPALQWIPQNRVDIFRGNSAVGPAPPMQVVNGSVVIPLPQSLSGLRLSDLAGSPAAQYAVAVAPMPFYLSVNTAGDVILVKELQDTDTCCATIAGGNGNPQPVSEAGPNQTETEIRALYTRVAALEAEVENLKYNVSAVSPNSTGSDVQSQNEEKVQFFQNDPNPFSESTDISYVIPESVHQATLIVTDRIGHVVYSQLIQDRGNGNATISASSLASGTYLYSIVADGVYSPGKKMVVIK